MANSFGATTALTGDANSLASGAYVSLGFINFDSVLPHDCLVDVAMQASAATSTATSQTVVIFARSSVDGTNFSGSLAANGEPNMRRIGAVTLKDTVARRSAAMSIALAFGGVLPPKVEVVAKNDTGVPLAASGQVGQFRTVTFG